VGWELSKVKEPAASVKEIALGQLALGDRRCVFEVNPVSVVPLEEARIVDLMDFRSKGSTPYSYGDPSAGAPQPGDTPAARILIVDDDHAHRNVLGVMMKEAGIEFKAVSSAAEALNLLRRERMDAVIADLNMPGVSGMDLLTEIRLHYPHLVFLMATGIDDVRLGVQAMRKGADDYLIKPLEMDVITVSLERAFHKKCLEQEVESYRRNLEEIVCKRTVQLQNALGQVERSYADTLDALGAAIDLRDGQTAGHSRRVALRSIKILTEMRGTPHQLKSIAMGAWLHDIGKLAIPDAILLKPGALTEQERTIIQSHVRIGYDLVKRIPFLAEAAEIILTHHERWDGSGYPRGLKGTDIPLSSRIFAVVDTLDAMTSDRPYRSALPFLHARNEIERLAGIHFDSQVVSVFLSIPNETWEAILRQASTIQISAALAGFSIENPGSSVEFVGPHPE
jgi:response regulator RpfG family c-di-GMP phosphodiesterase